MKEGISFGGGNRKGVESDGDGLDEEYVYSPENKTITEDEVKRTGPSAESVMKLEKQLEYEEKESKFIDDLNDVLEKKYGGMKKIVAKTLKESGQLFLPENQEKFGASFDDYADDAAKNSRAVVDSFIKFVKKRYPSPFDKSMSEEKKAREEAKLLYDYKRDSITKSESDGKNLKKIATLLRKQRTQVYNIAAPIDNISENAIDFGFDFSSDILDYADYDVSTKESKKR